MNIIKKIPIPISGLILAILSLGNLLGSYNFNVKLVCGIIGILLILLLVFRLVIYPNEIKKDLSNPIILSNSGTFSMALMILSTYLNQFSSGFALGVWILGVALHILLIICFTYRYIICKFDINMVYPSWWIVFVGITMGAITAHVHGFNEIGFYFFVFGFVSMIVTLPLMLYRYLKYPNKLDQNKPLICIFTALFSILIVGYINSSSVISNEFLLMLYLSAFILFLFALVKVIEYRKLDFYPSYSAFTFPFVITAIASTEVYKIINYGFLNSICLLQTIIAVILVIYVSYNYLKFLLY